MCRELWCGWAAVRGGGVGGCLCCNRLCLRRCHGMNPRASAVRFAPAPPEDDELELTSPPISNARDRRGSPVRIAAIPYPVGEKPLPLLATIFISAWLKCPSAIDAASAAFVILGRSRSEATCAGPGIHAVTLMPFTTLPCELSDRASGNGRPDSAKLERNPTD